MTKTAIPFDELPRDLLVRWKEFCRASPHYHSPFYWPQFTAAIASVRCDVRVAIFRRHGDVVGFLPFHLSRGGAGKPIGGQLNDYQGPVTAPGVSLSAAELLNAAGLASYDYDHLPARFEPLSAGATLQSVSPQMDLSQGYDALIARKGRRLSKARADIRRCSRKTEKDFGPLRFDPASRCEHAYRQQIRMKNVLLGQIGSRLRIGEGWIGKALHALWRSEDSEVRAELAVLHAGDRLIAAHLGLRAPGVLHWWFPAYDLAAHNLGPGLNLLDRCAARASDAGIRIIDFGKGDSAYKRKFADREVTLLEGSITRPLSLARLARNGAHTAVSLAEHLPLGRYASYPRRAAARYIAGVALNDDGDMTGERLAR